MLDLLFGNRCGGVRQGDHAEALLVQPADPIWARPNALATNVRISLHADAVLGQFDAVNLRDYLQSSARHVAKV
jgi:hypothetical protein